MHTHIGKAGVIGRLAAARAGVSTIIHTIHGPSFGKFQNAFLNNLLLRAERKAAGVTTHFVVVADAMKDQYLAAGIGQEDQYTKILSGLALDRFLSATNDPSLRKRYGLSPDDIVVGKISKIQGDQYSIQGDRGQEISLRVTKDTNLVCAQGQGTKFSTGRQGGKEQQEIPPTQFMEQQAGKGGPAPSEQPSQAEAASARAVRGQTGGSDRRSPLSGPSRHDGE